MFPPFIYEVRKQASELAEKTRNAYRAAEIQVEENLTNNLKTLWEQDRERRKQQLEEEIAEQNELVTKTSSVFN